MKFAVTRKGLPGLLLVEHERADDARGFFAETYRAAELASYGIPAFVQDNHSRSTRGVLRGLHYQLEPAAIGKLVRCMRGAIFDVAVDIRRGSPTYGHWRGEELSEENRRMLWLPPGFAHGICVLSEVADVLYKVTGYYSPEHDRAILWNDPAIGIEWPLGEPIVSPRDARAPRLEAADNNFVYPPREE